MFKRLILEDSAAIYTIAAFVVVATIFISFAWRAVRMSRRQVEHLELLPFTTPTPPAGGSGSSSDSSTANDPTSGTNPDPHSDES